MYESTLIDPPACKTWTSHTRTEMFTARKEQMSGGMNSPDLLAGTSEPCCTSALSFSRCFC